MFDVRENDIATVRSAGYSVTEATLGTPFEVPRSGDAIRVRRDGSAPGFPEQEVVVIQESRTSLADTLPPAVPDTGGHAIWSYLRSGVVDPRPLFSYACSRDAARIWAHGGVFVVFCREDRASDLVWATPGDFGPYGSPERLDWSTHSMVPGADQVEMSDDYGEEIDATEIPPVLSELRPYLEEAEFYCTLDHSNAVADARWMPLARNKFGGVVAALILPSRRGEGWVFLLPQVAEPGACVTTLLDSVLPDLAPAIFPSAEGHGWAQRAPYELEAVTGLEDRIMQVRADALHQEATLREAIEQERDRDGWMHTLLTGTGDELVSAVKTALDELGLEDVRKVDDEAEEAKEGRRREDLQIWGDSTVDPVILIEVKGIRALPREANSLQVTKYLIPRMRQWGRPDVRGLSIINHQRGLPPLDRENVNTFQEDVLLNAIEQGFGLLTTFDLFLLVRNRRRLGWTSEVVVPLFYESGRIQPIPKSFTYVGRVEGFYERASAVVVRLESGRLQVGDTIGYRLSIDYMVEDVRSIRVNDESVTEAAAGDRIGLLTSLSKDQARSGIEVYTVRPTS